ncbi:organic cation transporter-like protein [Trichonephila inaurata madagascariensis]|uniref:Organic cation transporter-like protein n=1 Tax=Trichonephila inaurata madagascariensis TaxID=2747483 RepID=A0A8X6IF29_9ARAC|nr:organic cation transporter-like protein [Trichonephila inaurata madagascariensis]
MPDWDEVCNGKYQILTAFLLCCVQLPITFSDHLLHLYGWTPPHRCRLPPQNGSTLSHALPWPIVEVKGRKMFSSCSMYVDPEDHLLGIQPCTNGWEYLHSEEEWTLATEWDLVCEREYWMTLLPYVYTVGTMLGGLLFGVLADHYGRRFNLLAALFLHTVVGVSLHFLSLFTVFAVGYSIQGILVTAIQCISFTLLLETVQYPNHLKATVFLCFVTPIGIITLSIISWLIKNWRYIQLAISAPGIVCLGYFWLIPRSLPWLLAEGYVNEAEKQLVQFARFNKVMLPHNFRVREVENTYNVPLAIYGFLSVIGGFLTSFLPANNHRPLPNVAIEVEKSMILEDSTRRKRNRLLNTPHPRMLDSIDVDILHFDEEQENERNNNLLELSVREFQNSRLPHSSTCHLLDVAGPSRLHHVTDKSSIIDKEDTESRLTDLEDELNKIWEQSPVHEVEAGTSTLAEFRHDDVREHYIRMNETRF